MADVYVVIHLGTTLDESPPYRTASELITLSWCVVEATTLETLDITTILVKPETPSVSATCLNKYNVEWEDLKNNGVSFRDAIADFDSKLRVRVDGKQFSFVTANLQLLRVLLQREARDKGVVMPVYLQHPRVFDLRNEYLKWQATHPEAMSYPSTSLSNVITALGVEPPAGWSDDTQDDAKVAPEVYAAILSQLVKKSIPIESHSLVLTKPYDAAQDAKAFLAERSKILFLSNLPAEVTQSELEMWFAQYGGRPIAFWNLKNVDTESKNCHNISSNRPKSLCGFAVFSKHDDAAEALYLNGRVLADRVIEVLASSTRILDRASKLLAPFSTLKNRPRPGDWNCPSCGFSNFQRRIACFRCSFPATAAVAIQEQMYNRSQNNKQDQNMARRHKQEDNQNSTVSPGYSDFYNGNSPHNYKNNSGFNANTNTANINNGNGNGNNTNNNNTNNNTNNNNKNNHNNINGSNNGYSHGYSSMHNGANGQRIHYNNNVPFRAGDWKCTNEACNYHNFAKNLCCLKCGGAKPASVVNPMQNGQSGSHQNHLGGSNQAHIHTLNTTAAAIAAATASGQPLSLNNTYGGVQRSQTNRLPTQGQLPSQSQIPLHMNGGGLYHNLEQLQQLQFSQPQGKPQVPGQLPQHLALLQGSGQSTPQNQKNRPKGPMGVNDSTRLYGQQAGFHFKGDNGANSGVNALSNHINSLSLNNTGM